jgi:putative ABC transport system permease protein
MAAYVLIVFLLSAPFLFVLARRPVLRRLAVRNGIRRPREALLVVVGSMLGAAIITGSFIVGDSMDGSIRAVARAHLGPVDELVLAPNQSMWEQLALRLQRVDRRNIDGVLPIATMDVSVSIYRKGHVVSAPRVRVLGVDFAAASRFGGDPKVTGVRGAALDEGHAAIGVDLARTLDVHRGDLIDVNAYGTRTSLFVDRIFPRVGVAGFWLGAETESLNVIVPPFTFAAIRGISSPYAAPPKWAVFVSNRGGIESGADRTDAATADIRAAAGSFDPEIVDIKRLVLDEATATGKGFSQMFSTMGSFGILAGLLLLVQLFVMLAAERKTELGMARAVGMRRSWLVGAFATEGWIYAVAATLLGTLAGVGLGTVLIELSRRAFNTEHSQFDLFTVIRARSLAEAFAIGFVIALFTIVLTSVRVSRLNIIRAIRDIPEPPPRRRRRWLIVGAAAAALGLVWTSTAFASEEPFGLLIGPALLLFGLAPALSRLWTTRFTLSALAAVAIAWEAVALAVFPDAAEGANVGIYVVQGVVLTGCAVVLAALQQEHLSAALRRLGIHSLALRLGLAYPLARRSRTGLTVAMYALVVFILTFITTISHMIDVQAADAKTSVRGGYDVVVSSSASYPIEPSELRAVRGVRSVAPLAATTAAYTVADMTEPVHWNLTAYDERFVRGGAPTLEDRGSYPSDAAAWRAVLADPHLIIVDPAFLQQGGGPPGFEAKIGTKVTVKDPISGRSRIVAVAAISPSDMLINNGAWYSLRGATTLFGETLVASRYYVGLTPGTDPTQFAAGLNARFLDNGADATAIDELMDEAFTMTTQVFQLFEGYLALGLLVGIAGIAVVMIRAVRERRRPIGTLRAIGYPSVTIGRSFAVETGFIALEGTIIGASLALLTLYTLVTRSDAMGDTVFAVPWLPLAILLVATVVASLLATLAPALSATRIRPAVALRTTD